MNINTAQRGAKLYARGKEKMFVILHLPLLTILLRDFIARGSVPALGVTSFSFKKEVTKKVNPDVPSGASLSVPRCKGENERSHMNFQCCASTLATTRGRRRLQDLLPLSKREFL